jgi:hypothetical protein
VRRRSGGAIADQTILERGSLISGQPAQLAFDQFGTIAGNLSASIDEVKPQFARAKPGGLDVTFVHPGDEYAFTAPGTLQIMPSTTHPSYSTATLVAGWDLGW